MVLFVVLLGAVVSAAITGAVRAYALQHDVLDVPNERSSHSVPVPRGGGLAITAVVLTGTLILLLVGRLGPELAAAILGGGGLVAWIGWRDDHSSVPAKIRIAVHFASAGWALFWLGGLPSLRIGEAPLDVGLIGSILAAVAIVWLINLYNFMDGIDGIASAEGVTAAGMGSLLSYALGAHEVAAVSALVAAACAGFLVWNWAPARIFMGDVGSGFLGFLLAILALGSERQGGPSLLVWGLLLSAFIFDATVTLIRRIARGERWSVAHRRHAYQRAVSSGLSHRQVTSTFVILNLPIFALAWAATIRPSLVGTSVIVTLVLLGAAYLWVESRVPMYNGDGGLAPEL
jgi:Fuc2NAc and GlcNAc transferase